MAPQPMLMNRQPSAPNLKRQRSAAVEAHKRRHRYIEGELDRLVQSSFGSVGDRRNGYIRRHGAPKGNRTPVSALRGPGLISEKEFEKEGGALKEDEQSLMLLSGRAHAQVCRTQHDFDNNAASLSTKPPRRRSTTSGVSLFASGIILRALIPTVSFPIVVSTVLRLAVVPALAFFVFPLAGVTGKALSDSVVALAMPCAVMLIILSVRYKIAERESASVLFYSYLFSAVSMTFAVLLTT
jgi:Membrane transport protein